MLVANKPLKHQRRLGLWHFLLLQGTTCSFALIAHQILLSGQTLRPRNMPKGCGSKMPL